MGPVILKEAIESVLDIKASQKIKIRKRNQTYLLNTIKKLRHEVYNLQIIQIKSNKAKLVISAELLQGIREQIFSNRRRSSYGERESYRGNYREQGYERVEGYN